MSGIPYVVCYSGICVLKISFLLKRTNEINGGEKYIIGVLKSVADQLIRRINSSFGWLITIGNFSTLTELLSNPKALASLKLKCFIIK